ncbi:hypothetical protein V1514DRAFT_318544 [Lipomyces japonicus]|uniref:uncharacterized protein n=1 Tax=Lipomyces japonicus TaxID=56871 RepID=UPI0034CE3D6C
MIDQTAIFETTLAKAVALQESIQELSCSLSDAIQNKPPIYTRGSNFLKKFEAQADKEVSALSEISEAQHGEAKIHRLRSSNLPNLEAVWKAFLCSTSPADIIALGTGATRPGGSDLVAEHGHVKLKLSRMNAQSIKREVSILVGEMMDDDEYDDVIEAIRNVVQHMSVYKLVERVVASGDAIKDVNEIVSAQRSGPKIIKSPRRPFQIKTVLLFCNICLDELSEEYLAVVDTVSNEIESRLKIRVQFDHSNNVVLGVKDMVNKIMREDEEYFLQNLPNTFNLDVTALLSITSDVTNLDPKTALARLEMQESQPDYKHKKSANAFSFLRRQIELEEERPLLKHCIFRLLRDGDILMCTRRAKLKFLEMVEQMGTELEIIRARGLFTGIDWQSTCFYRSVPLQLTQPILVVDSDANVDEDPGSDWVMSHVVEAAENYMLKDRAKHVPVATVTGNVKMARQIASRFPVTSKSCLLVIGPRSLLG